MYLRWYARGLPHAGVVPSHVLAIATSLWSHVLAIAITGMSAGLIGPKVFPSQRYSSVVDLLYVMPSVAPVWIQSTSGHVSGECVAREGEATGRPTVWELHPPKGHYSSVLHFLLPLD